MFEKTLTDVVKGIRASKRDTALYISQCIAEIKNEINSSDMFVKANALQKLTFLQMMGYSMGYASFATIEVMSSPRFAHKRIGYLAASQGFKQETEVILLATNLLKKELRCAVGGGMHLVYEAGLAINCVSNIITEDLARDLLPELTNLTTHPQPYLRKKAILCLFKLFVKYPQGLRLTFDRIQQCLDDANSSVVSCAVNVITELSDKNPKNYLHLAPQFFRLLTNSSNNWMLIKVVKLLGSLVPEEPRLARKLLDPLAEIVRNTQAKSLLYEAVRTITLCLPYCRKADGSMPPNVPEIVDLCARTLRDFVEQTDQNLKYLGLVGFGGLMQSHPRVLSAPNYRPLILACLSDQDVTIRNRALELMPGMVSRKNVVELVSQLLRHVEMATGTYKHNLAAKIIEICSRDKYELLTDFSWYLDILLQLGHLRGLESLGALLRAQVTDVALRVLPVRPYAVRRSIEVLLESEGCVSDNPYGDNGRGKHIVSNILPAVAWIIGEYSDLIREAMSIDPEEGDVVFTYKDSSTGTYHAIVQCLLDPFNAENLAVSTQKVYIQSAMKVFAAGYSDSKVMPVELEAMIQTINEDMPIFLQSTDVEVVERSFTAISLLQSLEMCSNKKFSEQNVELLSATSSQIKDISSNSPAVTSNASAILTFLLKPSPMKPCGAKAQRKKRHASMDTTILLDSPVNLSIFSDLITKECKVLSSQKTVLESLSFTQQQPLHNNETSRSAGPKVLASSKTGGVDETFNSNSKKISPQSNKSTTRQDPFYLASNPQSNTIDDDRRSLNRFGTIELVDSGDEKNEVEPKHTKKSKKAKKVKSSALKHNQQRDRSTFTNPSEFAVYESDDDDEDDNIQPNVIGKRKPAKEFEGLAKVDLTTPLRDDEIMPERKHRVVPERPVEIPVKKESVKKREKKPKNSKKSSTKQSAVGDLLDLGEVYNSVTLSSSNTTSTNENAPKTNAINLAFDDLLCLSAEPTLLSQADKSSSSIPSIPTLSDLFRVQSSNGLVSQDIVVDDTPWLNATIKASNDMLFSLLLLQFRPYKMMTATRLESSVTFRIQNNSSNILSTSTLSIPGFSIINFGSLSPGGIAESPKIGPFTYPVVDAAREIKGTLTINSSTCSVKIHLPATYHLIPQKNLTLDMVAQELNSPGWFSHSAKINLDSVRDPNIIKGILRSLTQSSEVIGNIGSSDTATFASISAMNTKCRFLIKVKKDVVKIDIKSTSEALGKAIASDLKRTRL